MGTACTKNGAPLRESIVENDIAFKHFTSASDADFAKLEHDYNLLKHIQLYEFLMMLTNHKDPGNQVNTGKSYNETIDLHSVVSFVDNKIFAHYLISEYIDQHQKEKNIFEDFMKELYEILRLAAKEYKKQKIKSINKFHLIPFALMFCLSSNSSKVNFFFNIFSKADCFERTPLLDEFIFMQIATASTVLYHSKEKIIDKYPELKGTGNNESLLDSTEVADLHRLKDILITKLFEDKKSLTRHEFDEKILHEDFVWIFSPKGIRHMLEVHNDKK
jgi:hypothetical protein